MSSGNQVRVGQWGATSRTCSSSSLSLHSVCASRLTGGNAYLRKARGQLCASASVSRGPSVREKYSWQWEDSGKQTGLPELPRINSRSARSSRDGVATLRGMWAVERACRPHDWASTSQFHWHFLLSQRWSGLPSKSPMLSRHNL